MNLDTLKCLLRTYPQSDFQQSFANASFEFVINLSVSLYRQIVIFEHENGQVGKNVKIIETWIDS